MSCGFTQFHFPRLFLSKELEGDIRSGRIYVYIHGCVLKHRHRIEGRVGDAFPILDGSEGFQD